MSEKRIIRMDYWRGLPRILQPMGLDTEGYLFARSIGWGNCSVLVKRKCHGETVIVKEKLLEKRDCTMSEEKESQIKKKCG